LKNISRQPINIRQKPIDGVAQAALVVQPGASFNLQVKSNTALIIGNPSNEMVDVSLKINGDTGLSMGYKNN
jgi:hypothetical protein